MSTTDYTATRAEAIKRISDALYRRSGHRWSVTGGKGTAYGWLRIDVPPRLRTWHHIDTGRKDDRGYPVYDEINDPSQEFGHMGPAYRAKLCELLGLDRPDVHYQGVSVPASSAHYREYIDRAETGRAEEIAERYWD